jgi:hypothetical protein
MRERKAELLAELASHEGEVSRLRSEELARFESSAMAAALPRVILPKN